MAAPAAGGGFWRSTGRLQSIDVLRGVAALAVVLCHVKHFRRIEPIGARFWLLLPLEFGVLGVPLFVVLSGFCIHLGVAKTMARTGAIRADWVAFWRRRFYRLYPPYLAAIALGVVSYYVARPEGEHPFQAIASLPWDLATHLLMVANLFKDYWAGVGNFPLWTLCMEEQLYLLYAAYILLRRALGPRALFVALGVSVAWALADFAWFPRSLGRAPLEAGRWVMWPFGYWFTWVLGAIAAEAYAGALILPNWCYRRATSLGAMAIGVATHPILTGRLAESAFLAKLSQGPTLSLLIECSSLASSPALAVAFFSLVNRWVRLETLGEFGNRLTLRLAGVGLFSYSLYLTHVPTINLAERFLGLGDGIGALALRYAIQPVLCVGVAYAFYRAIESRFLTTPHPKVTTRAVAPTPHEKARTLSAAESVLINDRVSPGEDRG